jgi:phosphopantothenate-cysteine ligase
MADNNGKNDDNIKSQLINFTTRHTAHHTPIALVTSGGTSAPLEHNCVRFLDNFSTGTRGAHAVEQFISKGYAVLHLKREGSVSPFGRLLNDALGCGKEGLTLDTFGKIFDVGQNDVVGDDATCLDLDEDDYLFHSNKESKDESQECPDPWLYSKSDQKSSRSFTTSSNRRRRGGLSLNHRLVNSTTLQATIRTYKHIKQQGLLLTINFQTVDDYLHKLQLCSEAINIAGPLGLVYLTAAVSDFYIPQEKRALHKIQSRDYGIRSQASSSLSSNMSSSTSEEVNSRDNNVQLQSDNSLTLTLYPVPKIIPSLRKEWCPNAFVVSFKLETDPSILRQKSVIAMEKNNVHLVIGNELATRYEKVFILSRGGGGDDNIDLADDDMAVRNNGCKQYGAAELPDGYHVSEVTAAHGIAMSSVGMSENRNKTDALEYATIEYVVRHHFHYISTCAINPNTGQNQKLSAAEIAVETTLKAKTNHDKRLQAQYRNMQRERFKARVVDFTWNLAGSALGMAISYSIARMLSSRQQHQGA